MIPEIFDELSQRTPGPGAGRGLRGPVVSGAALGDHAVDEVAECLVTEDIIIELEITI